ncbi:hypothetical protein HYS82_00530 [Candidatus Amesbacteria bacterium]|nr:hypothetical protein [Candidatus Amesbacteria bacterium]
MSLARFTPKRPIKSFQDLEIYQKLLAVSVAVAKRITDEKTIPLALDLPVKIATAHSYRFSDKIKALAVLEETMLGCNLLIVYLEQYRDIQNTDIEVEFFEEQITSLLSCRWKTMHLARSWEKFSQTI